MRKEQWSIKVSSAVSDYITRLSNAIGLSKSSTVEMLANIVDTYFSEEDIIREAKFNAPKDGRKKEGK